MTIEERLEEVLDSIAMLREDIQEKHDELLEKLDNLSTPGGDYGVEEV